MNSNKKIAALTLEQKCALLSGADVFKTRAVPGEPGEGIPAIWLSDGPHGLRKQAGESDHLGLNPSEPATCFPTAATIANSWDPALGEEIGVALGEEAIAQGVSVVLGPGLNIKRNPLCGRNFEYFSEDPYLAGKLAAGYIRGIQSKGVAACPKHFAVNNQETRRMASDSVLDERTLREIYLTGFEIAVREGKPASIMSSYNLINGVYANENAHLLQDILRGEWGFDGAVVTDWGGSNDHALGVQNGSTLEMPAPGGDSVRELMAAVKSGKISEQDVDARLAELLALIEKTQTAVQKPVPFDEDAHHALARRTAEKSLVLLKNEENLLPLAEGEQVALIGDFAETPRYQGAGSSVVNTTRLDDIKTEMVECGLDCVGYAAGFARHGEPNEALKAEAVALAAKAKTVLLCLGLDEIQESEGLDRSVMTLAQNQIELLEAVSKVNPRVVVLLHAGSALEMPWLGHCKALLYAALGGQAGAGAMLEAVTGRANPCGKLAETWPLHYTDTPSLNNFAGPGRTVQYREGLYVGYRYYLQKNAAVQFPFGYGLSYTEFTYSDLTADANGVSFTVTNTGSVAGSEIAQLYIVKPNSVLPGPAQQLKGFVRVPLAPGESQRLHILFDDKTFRYWNAKTNQWEIEGGRYEVLIGASCADIRLQTTVVIKGTSAPDPYEGLALPCYRAADVQQLPDAEFAALLGRDIPTDTPKIDRNLTFGQLKYGRSPLGWLICAIMTSLLNASIQKGSPDLNVLFIYNMPLRALAKMTNGMVSMGMVDGLVMEVKGFWIIGLLRVLVEFIRNQILNAAQEKRLKSAGEGKQ